MPDFNFREYKEAKAKEKLNDKFRCTAVTVNRTRCTIIVDQYLDDKNLLCHIHHPLRTMQQNIKASKY